MGIADARQHRGDMAVLAVEGLAALGKIPAQRLKTALYRSHRRGFPIRGRSAVGLGSHVHSDDLQIRAEGREVLAPAGT